MSSDKQAAIDIFTRLYRDDSEIRVLLNSDRKFKPIRAFSIAKRKRQLTMEQMRLIDRLTGKEGFSDDEWTDILTRATNPNTSTTTVSAASMAPAEAPKEEAPKEEAPKEEAPKEETKEEKPLLDHYKNVPSGTHVRIDVRATSFCPGFHIGAPSLGKRQLLYGDEAFIEFLKLWSQIKIKMSENDPLLLVDCSKLKKMNIDSYIKENAVAVPVIVILFSLIDFILNCIRQSLITNTPSSEFFDKLNELISYLEILSTRRGRQDNFMKIFMKNRDEIIHRLSVNAIILQDIVSSKVETVQVPKSGSGSDGDWTVVGKGKAQAKAKDSGLEWNYNEQLNAMNVKNDMGKIATSELAVKEFHMKKFIDETIKYWAEEYRASLSQYLLSRKSGSDVDFIKYKIEFMTKLIMLMLLDIKAVNPERTLQNKELYDKFSKCNLCFLLTQENADQERMKKTMSHLKRTEVPEKRRHENLKNFEHLMGRSFDWDNGMIFSPFDYYKTVIQAQESKQFENTGNDELNKSVEALNRLLSEQKTMFYGSSYTKMFSMAMDLGIDGTRSDFNFSDVFGNALNTSAVGKRLASQVVYTSNNVKIGLSSNGNLYVIHPGEQTHTGANRAKLMVEVLGSKFGFNEVVLCLGMVDIHSGALHNSLFKDDFNIADHIEKRTDSLQTWKKAADAGSFKLTYVLIPPMPQQNPMEIFAALYSDAFRKYLIDGNNLNYGFLQLYVKKSENIIEVCTKLADRSYYNQYSRALQEACKIQQIRLWRLTDNGIQQLQTCRSYDLMNIHYDYHLLRNLFFNSGEILTHEDTETLKGDALSNFVTTRLKTYPIPEKQMHEIQVLTKYKFHNDKPVKYWVLDGYAQLFKLRMFQFEKRTKDGMGSLKTALPIFPKSKPTLVNSTTPLEGLLKQSGSRRTWEDEGVLGYKFGESVQTAFQRKARKRWTDFNTWDALKSQLMSMLQRYKPGRGGRGDINHIEALLSTLAGLSFCTSTYKNMYDERQCTSLVAKFLGEVNGDILVVERKFNLEFLLDYYIGFLLSQPPRKFNNNLAQLLEELYKGLEDLISDKSLDPAFLNCSLLAPSTGSSRQDTGGSGGTGAKTGKSWGKGGGRKKTKKRMKKKRPRKTKSKRFHKKKHKTRKKKHSKRKRKHKTKRR